MNPVLVRGHISKVLYAVRIAGIVLLLIGIGLLFVERLAGFAIFVLAICVWVVTEARLWYLRRRQLWVSDTGHGFTVRDQSGERTYEDEDIVSLDLDTRNVYNQGVFKGVDRTFRVKVSAEPLRFEMHNRISIGEVDPLGWFVSRNINKYRDRANEALDAGIKLTGKAWSVSQAGIAAGNLPAVIPFDELQAVGLFDGNVCVWRRGADEAVLRVPVRSENAFLLQLILATRIPERAEDPDDAQQEGLGRVLFERKGSRATRVVLWILAGLQIPLSLMALGIGLARREPIPILIGLGIALAAAAAIWGIVVNRRWVFRCHQRGVFKRGALSETRLRYADVTSFSYSATRQYYNGVYIGTALNMVLTPGGNGKSVKFSQTVQNADEDLDELRNHISRVLATRMLTQLAAGERVVWTRHLTLLPTGIEYRPSGFTGRKDPVLLPFEQLHAFDIQQGTFHLWEKGKEKSVMQESVGEANFFPGYYALSLVYSQTSDGET